MVKQTLDSSRGSSNGTSPPRGGPVGDLDESAQLDKSAFEELLGKIDRGLRALPATAQVGWVGTASGAGAALCQLGMAFILCPLIALQCEQWVVPSLSGHRMRCHGQESWSACIL